MDTSDCPACIALVADIRPDIAYLSGLILVGQNRLEEEVRKLCPLHSTAMAVGASALNEAGDLEA